MVSHPHSTESVSTHPTTQPGIHRWLPGTALGLSLLAIATSGVLLAQVRSLDQKIQDVAAVSGSGQEHSTLKTQVANLNKTLQAQTTKVSELNQSISSTKQTVTQLNQDIAKVDDKVNAVRQTTQASVKIGIIEPQSIGHGFWVIDLIAVPSGRGTRLVGTVVNSTAIRYTDVIFNVKIGNRPAKPMTLAAIAAGTGESFSLDFPDIPADQAVRGQIDYVRANILLWEGE